MSSKKKAKKPSTLNKKARKIKKPKLKQSSTQATPVVHADKSKKKIKTKSTASRKVKKKSASLIPSSKKKKMKKVVSNKENIPNNDMNNQIKPIKKRKKKITTTTGDVQKVNESKPKSTNKSKRKTSSNIANIKKMLLSKDTNNASKNEPKKSLKKNPVSSKKKRKKMTRSNSYNAELPKPSNPIPQRRKISDIYSFGKKKKKKSNVLNVIKQNKVRKKKSDENEKKIHKKKKKKDEDKKVHKVKKSKIVKPANTERIIRKKVKTKTKRKELYVIGDYVEFGESKCGVIRYKGYINKRTGIWYGVELVGKDKNGECNGTFCGEQYFECAEKCGVFIMYSQIDRRMDTKQIDKILAKQKKKKVANMSQSLSERLSKQMIAASTKENNVDKKIEPKKKKYVKKKSNSSITVSKTPQLASQSKSNSNLSVLSLPNVQKTQKPQGQIVSMTPRGTSRRTNSNLANILSRGRKVDSLPKDKKRTRSLSNTREDNSWMTHKNTDNASERIKTNISKQKQLDLSSLIKSKSKNKKKEISKLFERHIESAKVIAAQNGASQTPEINKGKLIERLKDEQDAIKNAVDTVTDLGFCKFIRDNAVYRETYLKNYKKSNDDDTKVESDEIDLFDMNNIAILSNFEGKQRQTLTKVIVRCIVSVSTIEIVEICNCDIDDDFMEILCAELMKYYIKMKRAKICILSMQSNPISDRGMMALCKLIKLNHPILTMIKLQNNRRDISTNVCQKICEALEQNEYIIKFEFEFRHYAERDRRDKVIKRNAEKARLSRMELRRKESMS